jgi:thymidylate synthase (FAD)
MQETNIKRASVATLDEILGKSFPVLDHGHVRVIDYMGDDAAIVQAARVSYGAGTKQVHEDRGLIRYLLRNAHTTPFEMCKLKLHIRVPMDCWRQWIRHRTGVSGYVIVPHQSMSTAHVTLRQSPTSRGPHPGNGVCRRLKTNREAKASLTSIWARS